MELKTLKKDKEKLTLLVRDTDAFYINTIRRIVMAEVPTLAIDEVEFSKNDSALYDEIVAHRLGLLVLKTDLKSYTLKEKCRCKGKGCAHCQLHLSLNCNGPCTVYALNLKSKDPKIKPVYPDTPITKLLKGQQLSLGAIAVLGQGKEHTKFSPALVYYQAYPEIKVLKHGDAINAIKVCPRNVFKLANKKLNIVDPKNCNLCMACVDACGEDSIMIKGSEKDFILNIESWGQLKPEEIFDAALDIFDSKLDELTKELKKI